MYTTQAQVRQAFWQSHRHLPRNFVNGVTRPVSPQNYQPADTRAAFCDFVDYLARDGRISEALAARVTL